MSSLDSRAFRDTLGQFCSGVVIATGCLDGEPAGFAAQSFTSLSLEPPLVALCPGKNSTSWPRLRDSGSFCINILASDQQRVCEVFAQSGIDKFGHVGWATGITGSPIIDDVLAYIDCDLEAEHEAGDHTIAVGRVREINVINGDKAPLLFFRGGYGRFEELS